MAGRFSRSWEIFKASATVLREDKKLIAFPLVSMAAAIIAFAAYGIVFSWLRDPGAVTNARLPDYTIYVPGLILCFLAYLVIVFLNAALVAVAMARMEGRSLSMSEGLRFAWSRVGAIAGYAALAATVGLLLNFLEERLGVIGKFFSGVAGIAWTVATFLVVPVLINESIGPLAAVRESARLLKTTWGENIIATGGMGIVFSLFYIPLGLFALVATVVALTGEVGAGGLAAVAGILILVWLPLIIVIAIHAALQSIYAAALYRYATHGTDESAGGTISAALLSTAFRPKNRQT